MNSDKQVIALFDIILSFFCSFTLSMVQGNRDGRSERELGIPIFFYVFNHFKWLSKVHTKAENYQKKNTHTVIKMFIRIKNSNSKVVFCCVPDKKHIYWWQVLNVMASIFPLNGTTTSNQLKKKGMRIKRMNKREQN